MSLLFKATIFISLQKYSSKLANIRDLRSLTYKVKDLDAKLGPLKVCAINEVDVATKTAGKLQILEASDTNKVTEKGPETRVVGFEAKPQSLEVTPRTPRLRLTMRAEASIWEPLIPEPALPEYPRD